MEAISTKIPYPFLSGGREMGKLTANFDWSQSPVGSPGQWPHALRTTVSNLLRSKFPMFLWWGEDMIQFYNDAYRPSLGTEGKHPKALGQRGEECWPEIWDMISPLLHQVKVAGEATWREDQLVPIYRNGKLDDVYWTFSYSSVLDDSGKHGGILVTCTETTVKVLMQQQLFESEKLLRNTIYQAPVAICIFRGHELIIEEANEPMFKFWGKSSEQVMGKPLFEAIPESKNQGYEELLENVFETGNAFSAQELPVTLPRNGEVQTVYINFSYNPIIEVDSTITGIMAMAIDVTDQVLARHEIQAVVEKRTLELAEANNALLVANRELKRSNDNLKNFAYAASHDLQEPVRKIITFSERIMDSMSDKMSGEEKNYMQRMASASERMKSMIDELLTYSEVSSNSNDFKEINLNQLLLTVIEDLDLEIEEKKAFVTTDELCIVQGNHGQLQHVFHNLLSNALKYHKPGVTPQVHITCRQVFGREEHLQMMEYDQQQSFYCIEVKDNGIGFEQTEAEGIFNVFTRLNSRHEYTGSGIGLSIARKAVENHKGYIFAESQPGEGATFKVLLPL